MPVSHVQAPTNTGNVPSVSGEWNPTLGSIPTVGSRLVIAGSANCLVSELGLPAGGSGATWTQVVAQERAANVVAASIYTRLAQSGDGTSYTVPESRSGDISGNWSIFELAGAGAPVAGDIADASHASASSVDVGPVTCASGGEAIVAHRVGGGTISAWETFGTQEHAFNGGGVGWMFADGTGQDESSGGNLTAAISWTTSRAGVGVLAVFPEAIVPAFVNETPPTTGLVGTAYAGYVFTATGAPSPTFSIQTGSLPVGLSLSAGGVLSGTPTAAGDFTFTVRATNASGTDDTTTLSIDVSRVPELIDETPPLTGNVGVAYAGYTFAATGAPWPTLAVLSGSLPPGLALTPLPFAEASLSGTPTTLGAYDFVVQASNSVGTDDTATLTITITSAAQIMYAGGAYVIGR